MATKEYSRNVPHRAKSKSKPKRGRLDKEALETEEKTGSKLETEKLSTQSKQERQKKKDSDQYKLDKAKAKRRKRKTARPGMGGLLREQGFGDHRGSESRVSKKIGKWFGVVGDVETTTTVTRKDDGKSLTIANFFFDNDSSEDEDKALLSPSKGRVIFNAKEALKEYDRFIRREKALKKERVAKSAGIKMFPSGESSKMERKKTEAEDDTENDEAEDKGMRANSTKAPERSTAGQEASLVQEQLRSLPTFEPHFITFMTLGLRPFGCDGIRDVRLRHGIAGPWLSSCMPCTSSLATCFHA